MRREIAVLLKIVPTFSRARRSNENSPLLGLLGVATVTTSQLAEELLGRDMP